MSLLRLFAWLDRVLGAPGPQGLHGAGIVALGPSAPPMSAPARPAGEPVRNMALLSVDGAGQYLLCGAERLTLGHLRAGRADLGFLADVGAVHAELVRADSLQSGPGWRIVPVGAESVRVEGQAVPADGRRLLPGERVRLGENLEFRLHLPDPASASAVLELLHGVECAGARHVLLLAAGPGGRVRIGAGLADPVRVPGLELGLALEWHAGELRVLHEDLEQSVAGESPSFPFPPATRVALVVGKARGSRPPFGLSLEPVERPGPERGRA